MLLRGSSSAELCFVSGCIAIALRLRHATSYRLVLDFRPLCDNLLVSGLDAARSASMLYSAKTSFVMRPAASKFVVVTANARIWAGFHYRFSTRVGSEMGRQIGEYVVKSVMQPAHLN